MSPTGEPASYRDVLVDDQSRLQKMLEAMCFQREAFPVAETEKIAAFDAAIGVGMELLECIENRIRGLDRLAAEP